MKITEKDIETGKIFKEWNKKLDSIFNEMITVEGILKKKNVFESDLMIVAMSGMTAVAAQFYILNHIHADSKCTKEKTTAKPKISKPKTVKPKNSKSPKNTKPKK